ncbi:cyclin-D-binding Myb-like transcription factor 1 [Uloborus diversus]|uniref:cyclin-D-binding Myb-like transcription factor 1 n=1 Tax=Uloborus diversus TaxID=327109 RepID=UPI002409B718|nr:cyclin-D-binding Myb-like transcription factor 1 [Uloborus diversus]
MAFSTRTWSDEDFIDEPVKFEVPVLHRYETFKNLTVEQRKSLINDGAVIKYGKFSKEEDRRILKNLIKFIDKYDFDDTEHLLGIGNEKNDQNLLRFKKAKHFPVRLGRKLNDRMLYSIYKRARLLILPPREEQQFNKKDVENVKLLAKFVGKKWSAIGKKMGVSNYRCYSVHRWHEKKVRKGKWSSQEIESLTNAIQTISGASDINFENIQTISWDQVADLVGTRNPSQCRIYWLTNLAWSCNVNERKSWNTRCYQNLIRILSESNIDNEAEINWKEIQKQFFDCSPSYYSLQKKWLYLKRFYIPSSMENFKEIIMLLKQKFSKS